MLMAGLVTTLIFIAETIDKKLCVLLMAETHPYLFHPVRGGGVESSEGRGPCL